MARENQLKIRALPSEDPGEPTLCYYAKSLYYDEEYVAVRIAGAIGPRGIDGDRVADWVHRYTSGRITSYNVCYTKLLRR